MRAITDPTGAVLASYTFDPWGKVSAQSGTFSNPYRYGGEYQDDLSSLYYLRARYCLPDIGRFTSPDSYAGDPGDPLSLNLYTYVQNSPLRYLDPTGHVPAACFDDPFGQMLAGLVSSLFNFIPVVGEYKGLFEAMSGQDLFTGQHLSWGQRLLSAVPFAGGIGRGLSAEMRFAFSAGEAGEGYSLARSAQSFIQDEGGFIRPGMFMGEGGNGFEVGSVTGYTAKVTDLDLRGSATSFSDALEEAFRRTGVDRSEFKVTKWGYDQYGKSFPVEWRAPGGAEVSVDWPYDAKGPDVPHIGWQTPGKRLKQVSGHIFLDDVPYNRGK